MAKSYQLFGERDLSDLISKTANPAVCEVSAICFNFLKLRKSYFTPAREFVLEFKGNLEQGIIAFTIYFLSLHCTVIYICSYNLKSIFR